jgi:hypothetical protein
MASLPIYRVAKPLVSLVACLLTIASLAACGSGGENVEICRLYINLVDETQKGTVSPDEYYRRVQPNELGQFEEGSPLRRLHEDLIESLKEDDLDRAQTAEAGLQQECMGTINQ